jgi:AraC-like DNA-binding protein
MQPEVHILFSSDFYKICNYKCQCQECSKSKKEFNENFSLCFIRTGNFYYHTFRGLLDSYTGSVLISKPGYEYNVTHPGSTPDECTIIVFTKAFYKALQEQFPPDSSWFFKNKDIQSLLLKIGPEIEYLHDVCLQIINGQSCSKLEVDTMVIQLLQQAMAGIGNYEAGKKIPERIKKNHLATIEMAKLYMRENFIRDISLMELAKHCHVSSFHFSRIFKSFTRYSPYQYLQLVRLKQAEILLRTNLPVADIAFSSGFNSVDYFSSAFKKKYKMSPSVFRTSQKIQQDF